MGSSLETINGAVQEIMRIHRSLPKRPSIDEVEAAEALILGVERDEQAQVDAISNQRKAFEIPDELFFVLQEMQKRSVFFRSKEQKREGLQLLDLLSAHIMFDELLQRASACLPSSATSDTSAGNRTSDLDSNFGSLMAVIDTEKETAKRVDRITRDDSFFPNSKSGLNKEPNTRPAVSSKEDSGKLSLMKLAGLIETYAKNGTLELNLMNKLMNQVAWIPDSIEKLIGLITLDLSENRLVTLPTTIGALVSLKTLDIHSNQIAELPESLGDLKSLSSLNVFGNQLVSLPSTFGKLRCLQELDLSSNRLSVLPDSIGDLANLKKLNVETNNLEEFPYTIGNCGSLEELRADYNCLKCLPEGIGKLESLQVLTVRYNNLKGLPTTLASMSKLKEIDASFNELEHIPESLCLVTSLTKLNIGNNFANLLSIPRSIGNLGLLEELDVSNNQIKALPESFGKLSQLRVLRAEENPLEVPPRQIAEKGALITVQYMAELATKLNETSQTTKINSSWGNCCCFSTNNKVESDWDYAL